METRAARKIIGWRQVMQRRIKVRTARKPVAPPPSLQAQIANERWEAEGGKTRP